MTRERSVHPRLSNTVWVEFVGRRYGDRYAIIIKSKRRGSERGVNDNEIVYVYNECAEIDEMKSLFEKTL